MPIDKTEFQKGKNQTEIEDNILAFLNERKENAFTSNEVMEGVNFHSNFSTLETTRISTFAIADFNAILHDLVSKGRIRVKIVEGQVYFATGLGAGTGTARCPKCGTEIAEPRRTWKMTGRPDKKGQRLQLQIGLFKCPKHGNFRKALSKQKV